MGALKIFDGTDWVFASVPVGALVLPEASLPSSPALGQVVYDTTNKMLRVWDGTAWSPQPWIPYGSVYRSTNQNVPNSSWTKVSFDSTVRVSGIVYSAGVFTVQRAGLYMVISGITFAGNSTGRREVQIMKGATSVSQVNNLPVGAQQTNLQISAMMNFAVGDTVSVQAFQTSGAGLDVTAGDDTTNVRIAYINSGV